MGLEAENVPRILCVDDEPRVLEGIRRTLGLDYEVCTAPGGAEALQLLKTEGPFSVTISDMRMPGMDGAAYLKQAAELAPDCVRMLLTGQADMEAAIKAVNEGRLFRFLTKPCAPEALKRSVDDGVAQHRLINAEKQLLEHTLYGVINVLTEVLSLANPVAFARASRVKRLVTALAAELGIDDAWQFELAIMLAHIGCVGVPQDLLTRAFSNQSLEPKERELVSAAPRVAFALLESIPRIEVTLGILAELASKPPPVKEVLCAGVPGRVAWGTHIILLAERADQLRVGSGLKKMLAAIATEKHFDERVLGILLKLDPTLIDPDADLDRQVKEVSARELRVGLVLVEDVCSRAGVLMVKGGQEVTATVIQLLRRMAEQKNLVEPLKVAAPPKPPLARKAIRIRL